MQLFLLVTPIIIAVIFLIIKGIRYIYILDPIFIAVESIFFLFLAMRPFDNWFFGHSFLDPGDEATFTPWYQKLVTSLSTLVGKNGWDRSKCLIIACVTVAIIAGILIFLEFGLSRFKFGFIINICVKYPLAIAASWLIADNARFLMRLSDNARDLENAQSRFVAIFIIALIIHLIVLLAIDLKSLDSIRRFNQQRKLYEEHKKNERRTDDTQYSGPRAEWKYNGNFYGRTLKF